MNAHNCDLQGARSRAFTSVTYKYKGDSHTTFRLHTGRGGDEPRTLQAAVKTAASAAVILLATFPQQAALFRGCTRSDGHPLCARCPSRAFLLVADDLTVTEGGLTSPPTRVTLVPIHPGTPAFVVANKLQEKRDPETKKPSLKSSRLSPQPTAGPCYSARCVRRALQAAAAPVVTCVGVRVDQGNTRDCAGDWLPKMTLNRLMGTYDWTHRWSVAS